MKFFTKMERKFGRYAIRGLSKYIVIAYVIGYIVMIFYPEAFSYMTLEPALILQGQLWRLVTWLVIPPQALDLFTIIFLFFYFSIGSDLERAWGSFRYNVFIFGGILLTIIGAFVAYFILKAGILPPAYGMFSTYYILLSIFMGFAATYPEMRIMIYFIIPLKAKWLSAIYLSVILYTFMNTTWIGKIAIGASILNFLIFFLITRNTYRFSRKEIKRKQEFKKSVAQGLVKINVPRHTCAVCGKTEKDDPDMEFRYCSKCNGTYEYCMDHLFTHEHVKE